MEDILIKDARIIDGGNPWYRGSFVSNGKVADVGKTLYDKDYKSSDVKVIDAEDKVVSPGFIDIHSHSDFLLLRDRSNIAKISQGVTTEIVGQCGLSPAPVSQQYLELLKEYTIFIHAEAKLDWSWTSLGEYMKMMEENKVGLNIGFCIGHGTVRLAVMGFRESKASLKELYEMKDLVAEAMEDGAYGITSGLIYPPGVYADTEELIELCKVVASYGGVYTTHMRNESDSLLDAFQEALTIGRKSKIPVQISHHKACGKQNWGRVKESLKLIEQARDEGIDVTIDQYPYPAHSNALSAIIPPWAQEGGIDALCERLSDNKEKKRSKIL